MKLNAKIICLNLVWLFGVVFVAIAIDGFRNTKLPIWILLLSSFTGLIFLNRLFLKKRINRQQSYT